MNNIKYSTLLMLILLNVPNAWALMAAANSECVGGAHVVTVSGVYMEEVGGEIYDGEISGLVFECQAIGVCEPSFFFPETPLPFDPQPNPGGGWLAYEAECTIVPPLEGVAYRYIPYGVRPDGTLVTTGHYCSADSRSYALASCHEVPIARGVLTFAGSNGGDLTFHIESCEPDCWSEGIWTYLDIPTVEELSGQPWGSLFGQVVDLYGTRTYCTMLGGDYHELSGIALSPGGNCGPVPTESESWDSLKAKYR